jgi:peptidoglycan hydrolase-like protein with peptidoglycan-binding domain
VPQQSPAGPQVRSPRSARHAARGFALCAALAGFAVLPVAAQAENGGAEAGSNVAPAPSASPRAKAPAAASSRRALVVAVQRRLHLKADGAFGSRSRAAVRRFQARHHLRVTGRLDRATLSALGVTAVATTAPAPAPAAPSSDAAAVLARIAQCESGGDPTSVSPDGRYHGKYQFDTSTWHGIGGSGDADAAPEAEQDERAAALYAKRGTDPWPTCGPQATR